MNKNNPKDLVSLIKEIALNAVNNECPSDFLYGTVLSINPLRIQINSKLTLESSFLIVPQHLTDYEVEMTPRNGERRTYTVHNSLRINDKVILGKFKGGQDYIIIDRM